ncbi:MAG: oxidoreductase-like domain-containing protein [Pseudomonadota bacterium]|nr:oxidoreductase-like domain-containing protein [Pseudomonadota bacterium]
MPDPEDTASPDPPPLPPPEPDPTECCGEGCIRCVWDVHDEAMEVYRERLVAWKGRHPGKAGIPGAEGNGQQSIG